MYDFSSPYEWVHRLPDTSMWLWPEFAYQLNDLMHNRWVAARAKEIERTRPDEFIEDFEGLDNTHPCAWVTPRGRWYAVRFGGHSGKLEELFGRYIGSEAIERAGWCHAGGRHEKDYPRGDGKPLTLHQKRTLEGMGYFVPSDAMRLAAE